MKTNVSPKNIQYGTSFLPRVGVLPLATISSVEKPRGEKINTEALPNNSNSTNKNTAAGISAGHCRQKTAYDHDTDAANKVENPSSKYHEENPDIAMDSMLNGRKQVPGTITNPNQSKSFIIILVLISLVVGVEEEMIV